MPDPAGDKTTRAEVLATQLTGFLGPTREKVAGIGSTADQGSADGGGWLRAKIEREGAYPSLSNPVPSPLERVVKFYDWDHKTNLVNGYFKVTLSVPWNENGNDFSDNGYAGAFDHGYEQALKHLVSQGNTKNFTHSCTGIPQITKEDAVDLGSLLPSAKAFDETLTFFTDYGTELDKWVKDLGGEDAAWQGSAADVFRTLVTGVRHGYKDLQERLTPFGTPPDPLPFDTTQYKATSTVGQEILRCAVDIHKAASAFATAWTNWLNAAPAGAPAGATERTYIPTYYLNVEVDKAVQYLNENNIGKVHHDSNQYGTYSLLPGFSIYHPLYGDLTQQEAWRNVARQAYKAWLANVEATLDVAATTQARAVNDALRSVQATTFTFNPGFTDLKSKFVEEATKQKQKELEDKQKELEDKKNELDKNAGKDGPNGGGPPPLGPNGLGGGLGGNKDLGGNGKDEKGGQKPPGLDTGVKPPPLLDPNNLTGGKDGFGTGNTVRTPDGSTIVRNPDGSYTTTYPDGRKETTPAGTLPPLLQPNPTGPGPGTGNPVALRTVKGPDGSTTSYNQDGSRTTTHKDGTTTTVTRDGTTTTVNPDGSTTVLRKDGSQTITYPDGTKTTFRPDGSSVTQYKDGTVQNRATDGTLTTTDPEGNKKVTRPEPGQSIQNPDRSTTTFGKDGSTTTVHANGTRTTVSPNGTITTIDPDGTKTISHLGKNTSTIEYADGSVATVDKDGTVITTYKDGSSTRLAPDGTYTTTESGGQKKTEHLNPLGGNAGAETKHNPDGSTTTRYPDGTVDHALKNGGHKITYPDGRTVTTDADGRTVSVTGGSGGFRTSSGTGRFTETPDYYDFLDGKKKISVPPPSSGYGDSGRIPLLSANPLGPGVGFPTSPSGLSAATAERLRTTTAGEVTAGRARAAQIAAEEAVAMRRPATTSGGMPMMPPMGGGMGGAGGQGTQSDERERSTWISEDEDVWGTDEGGVAGVIGR
ncbi:AAWKG family protein [Streptomyces sp. NPDC001744]|uniref:AAWKG family protein n=1 Tax=Streptomyces sp. NPDC001744 TaxID=3364606 RepID=UPI0036768F76